MKAGERRVDGVVCFPELSTIWGNPFMSLRRAVWPFCVFFLFFTVASTMFGSDIPKPCGVAPVVAANSKPNIFSAQQEQWLGEVERDEIEAGMPMIKDTALNQHLQELVDRLVVNLPEPHVTFHAVLVDSSEVNGWSIAGGNIYITRKLAATVKNDDELAAVLGHEMGHIAAHQFAFEMTVQFARLLHVSSVGGREDVRAKYEQLVEAEMRDKSPPKSKEDTAQDEADQIGVYLMAEAGFRASAFPEAFDREFYLEGKTGSKVSDFFGMTRPDQKRLRGMRQLVAALPAGCGVRGTSGAEQFAFEKWRDRVVVNQKGVVAVVAPEAVRLKLKDPLQMEINFLRYSPNGKYLLAQDYSSVYVIDVKDTAVLFRADAEHADEARFSPDSKKVTFMTPGLHTEIWDIDAKKLLEASEPTVKHTCVQTKLSPDGRTIFCASFDQDAYMVRLAMLDAKSGDVLWEKKDFFQPTYYFAVVMMMQRESDDPIDVLDSSFSSDGNYVLIGPASAKLAFDLRTRTPIKVEGALKGDVSGSYAFLGSDRVAGVNLYDPHSSGIYHFPDGKRLQKVLLNLSDLSSVSDTGDHLYVKSGNLFGKDADGEKTQKKADDKDRDKIETRMGVVDLAKGYFVFGSRSDALDVWQDQVATESTDGKVLLNKLAEVGSKSFTLIPLPDSRLGGLRAIDLSPDGVLLALSTRDRGAVWNLQTGERQAMMRPFSAGHWIGDKVFVGEFEKSKKQDRDLVRIDFASQKSSVVNVTVSKDDKDYGKMWYDSFAEWKKQKGKDEELLYHALDDGKVLWTRDFPEGYPRWTQSLGGRDLIFSFPLTTNTAKTAVNGDERLRTQAATIKKKEDARLVDVVDGVSGGSVERMVLDLPMDYEGTDGLNRVGEQLYVSGLDNRTLAYSLKTGKRLWQAYGWLRALDPASQRICIVNRSDEAVVYDASGKELNHTRLGVPIRYAAFEKNGTKLIMLGADQVISEISVDAGEPAK